MLIAATTYNLSKSQIKFPQKETFKTGFQELVKVELGDAVSSDRFAFLLLFSDLGYKWKTF